MSTAVCSEILCEKMDLASTSLLIIRMKLTNQQMSAPAIALEGCGSTKQYQKPDQSIDASMCFNHEVSDIAVGF
jgi:hypothetical protein